METMNNDQLLELLKIGDIKGFNEYRKENPDQDIDFKRADLYKANLRGANLSCVFFEDADFRYADLRGADFKGANLYSSNFSFRYVILSDSHLELLITCLSSNQAECSPVR